MTTRSALVADLRSWSARDDLTDAVIVTALRLAQAAIDRDLRLQDQQKQIDITVSSAEGGALPTDFLDVRSVALKDPGTLTGSTFNQETVNQFNKNLQVPSPTPAQAWAIRGDRILVRPTPTDTPVELSVEYFERFAPLVAEEGDNWLLINQYDVYFAASMTAVAQYLEDESMEIKWQARYNDSVGKVQKEDKRKQIPTVLVHNTLQASVIG